MKTTKNLMAVLFVAILLQPFLFKAQGGQIVSSAKMTHKADETRTAVWNAVKLDEKGSNVKNGVEFYIQKSRCNTQKVTLVKLVNKNNYPVKVSYQLSENSPVMNVAVQPLATLEGACGSLDNNAAKLVVDASGVLTEKTEQEKQKVKDFLRAHLVVTQVQ